MKKQLAGTCILVWATAFGCCAFGDAAVDDEDAPDLEKVAGSAAGTGLTGQGQKLKAKYEAMLDSLKKEVIATLPAVDEGKKACFLALKTELDAMKEPAEDSGVDTVLKYRREKAQAESNTLDRARLVMADIDGFLASDKRDEPLMKVAIITHGTPQGLAEFAQQGVAQETLLDQLFNDPGLMKQALVAGGANGGEYGEAMAVYAAIQEKSERARERGSIFQRLALGTALHQPWLEGREKGGVYGVVHADCEAPGGPVERYLHYEKAYLDGELDPAFKDMDAWACRFITNDPYTNEELAWVREMMRNYRPDQITDPEYKWRYARIVKSDVPYKSPDWRPDEGTTRVQQIVAGGGKCGPRAFFGRTACRAFGIPARRSTQTGHAAMNHWTPDGWVVCFGGWWSWNWCGPWGGLDFLLESQARAFPDEFMKVLRAQWVGDVLGEQDVSIKQYGKGGGLWNALAFYKKQAVVAEAKEAALQDELAKLTGDEAKVLLGESDAPSDDDGGRQVVIRDEDKTIRVNDDGMITIPAAACASPTNSSARIIFMNTLKGEAQVHYARLGKQPELLKYYVEVPKAGKYELTAHVVTVARDQKALIRLNRRTLIDMPLPSTWGMWQDTKPVAIDMVAGRNTLMFTCEPPNRGVSIKCFRLMPVK